MKYFAYGSNMDPAEMSSVCPSAVFVATARIDNYRLAFTRRSSRTRTGVSDLVSCPGASTFGVLYEVSEADLEILDRKEGRGKAYDRQFVDVYVKNERQQAITYVVITKEQTEVLPSSEYLQKIIRGAEQRNLREEYATFLRSLSMLDERTLHAALIAGRTVDRPPSSRGGVAVVSSEVVKGKDLGTWVAVTWNQSTCLAVVEIDDSLKYSECRLDQGLRHALGIRGRLTFGHRVSIDKVHGVPARFPLVSPPWVYLPAFRPAASDSERGICVLHPNSLKLLGVSEGERLCLSTVAQARDGSFVVHRTSRRALTGSVPEIKRVKTMIPYPQPSELYIDLDGRRSLSIPDEKQGWPVLITANVSTLLARRLVVYGVALFIALVALLPLGHELGEFLGYSKLQSSIAAVLLASVVTLGVCVVDLRGHIQG